MGTGHDDGIDQFDLLFGLVVVAGKRKYTATDSVITCICTSWRV